MIRRERILGNKVYLDGKICIYWNTNKLAQKKRERTLSDAPATGRTMKGHLTVASHGDLRCCVKYIRRFSFLFVSSPFFLFLRRPTIVISYWPWSIGSLTAIGGWCNGSWCFDGCDASWWAACWPVLRCDEWFGLTPSRSRVTKDRIVPRASQYLAPPYKYRE